MASLKVYYDAEGKTLTVWFGDPSQEHVAEEKLAVDALAV